MSIIYTPSDQAPPVTEYTLPQDGDPAVVSSVNTAFSALADNVSYLLLLTAPQYNVKNYGAIGDGIADDGPAITEANIQALFNNGVVVFPPCSARYRVTTTINATAPWVGIPKAGGVPQVYLDDSSAGLLNLSASVTITNLNLKVKAGNTGTMLSTSNSNEKTIVFRNCLINDFETAAGSSGYVVQFVKALEYWSFRGCTLGISGPGNPFYLGEAEGSLSFEDCSFRVSPGFAGIGIVLGGGEDAIEGSGLWNCSYDWNYTGTGLVGSTAVYLDNWMSVVTGCQFLDAEDIEKNRAFSWPAGTRVCIGPCSYSGMRYPWGAPTSFVPGTAPCPPANRQSIITWRGQWRIGESGGSNSPNYILRDGYDSYVCQDVYDSVVGPPTIYLPQPQPGKSITIVFSNQTGTDYLGNAPYYNLNGSNYQIDVLPNTQTQVSLWTCADFIADTYKWTLVASRTGGAIV